jgi:hypothetical protein
VAPARGTPSYYDQIRESHNPNAILQAINSETAVPYGSVETNLRNGYMGATIRAMDQFGAFILHNADEITGMCPNFEALNISQKKAVMVFIFSEIFKQTSNYNSRLVTPVTISGRQTNRVGLCQIEYQETRAIYESLGLTLEGDETFFNTYQALDLSFNLDICISRLMQDRLANPSQSHRPLRAIFPNVDFNTINPSIRSLNMCQTN